MTLFDLEVDDFLISNTCGFIGHCDIPVVVTMGCCLIEQVNSSNVVCPVIDVISWEKLEYSTIRGPPGVRGGFNWGLQFKWKKIPDYEQVRRSHDETR